MKKKIKKIISIVLCIVMMFGIAPLNGLAEIELPEFHLSALNLHLPKISLPDFSSMFSMKAKAEDATSGRCGDNLTWSYDADTYTLTISGTGEMYTYTSKEYGCDYVTTAPWKSYYYSMKTAIIENNVTSIADDAFYGCTGLTSITIGNGVTSIADDAFYGCTRLTSITIPDSVTSINGSAFYNTAYYNNASNWTNGILYIGNYLIECETDIAGNISVKSNTLCIADYAFLSCTKLTSITLPDSVTSIGRSAFSGCSGLTSITIPSSVTSIGDYTFQGCSGLTSITIPNSVTSIGSYTFSGCPLEYVKMGSGLKSIPSTLIHKDTLKTFIIGDNVTSISNSAFYGCTGLTSITIPNSVTSIDGNAFWGCTGLKDIYYSGTKSQWADISKGANNSPITNAVDYTQYDGTSTHARIHFLIQAASAKYNGNFTTSVKFSREGKDGNYTDATSGSLVVRAGDKVKADIFVNSDFDVFDFYLLFNFKNSVLSYDTSKNNITGVRTPIAAFPKGAYSGDGASYTDYFIVRNYAVSGNTTTLYI